MSYLLRKYYYDAIDRSGRYFYCYDAHTPLFRGKIQFDEFSCPQEEWSRSRVWLSATQAPLSITKGNEIRRHKLELSAQWTGGDQIPPYAELNTETFDWKLVQVRSDARLSGPHGALNSPYGYGECLTLRAKPWDLGLTHLSWGRFICDQAYLVWIVGRGEQEINFAVSDLGREEGVCREATCVTSDKSTLDLQDMVSEWHEPDVLDTRSIIIRGAAKILWSKVPKIQRSKKLVRCKLNRGGQIFSGLAIFEDLKIG